MKLYVKATGRLVLSIDYIMSVEQLCIFISSNGYSVQSITQINDCKPEYQFVCTNLYTGANEIFVSKGGY